MSFDYLDDAVMELAAGYRVATYQQRGLAPSTEEGEFTIAEAVADLAAVLVGLGWDTAYVVGHSWGGHLVLHAATGIPDQLAGVLSVDPLGALGDGGGEAFGAEMLARVPEASRDRVLALGERDAAGQTTPEEAHEAFSLVWGSYFADPLAAPPMPRVELSTAANQALWGAVMSHLPELESSLSSIRVPVGVLVGELSPMPTSAGVETAQRIPGAWWHIEPGAGHFVWHESPG